MFIFASKRALILAFHLSLGPGMEGDATNQISVNISNKHLRLKTLKGVASAYFISHDYHV